MQFTKALSQPLTMGFPPCFSQPSEYLLILQDTGEISPPPSSLPSFSRDGLTIYTLYFSLSFTAVPLATPGYARLLWPSGSLWRRAGSAFAGGASGGVQHGEISLVAGWRWAMELGRLAGAGSLRTLLAMQQAGLCPRVSMEPVEGLKYDST